MSKGTAKTKVIFRRWKDGQKDIIAIFPELTGTCDKFTCSSYQRIGQHGACDPTGLINTTTPVNSADPDCQSLIKELTAIGYNLQIIQRLSPKHLKARERELN